MSHCKHAIILAAGLGSRLGISHGRKPKGFISIGGEALVRRSIRLLLTEGVETITLLTGYLSGFYEDLTEDCPELQTIHNEQYARSGSMYSLWCARHIVSAPFLLLESDLIYERRALTIPQKADSADAILISGKTGSGDEVYVETSGGHVCRMSKHPSELNGIGGELVGISKISPDTFSQMIAYAERWFTEKGLNLEYEQCINGIIQDGAIVPYIKVNDLLWTEIDDTNHLNRATTRIFPAIVDCERRGGEAVPRKILLNPGPATTTDTVKRALVMSDICHREREFLRVSDEVHRGLVDVVNGGDDYAAVTFAGSGTAAVEATIGSVVPRDRKILIIDNGAYGARMRQIASALGIGAVVLECSCERPPLLSELEAALVGAKGTISHVSVVHHETTTGLLNPVRECAAVARKYGADVIVDAMSSYAGIPMDIRDSGIDYLISSANKCLQGMPGISFAICRRDALDRAAAVAPRSVYLSLVQQYRAGAQGGEARFTPPVQLFYALRQALREYFFETGERRYRRYIDCYRELLSGMKRLGLQPFLPENLHSGLLTSFVEPDHPNYSFDAMHDELFEKGFTIYPGKVATKHTFRLANIGAIEVPDIQAFLHVLEAHLRRCSLL